MKIKESPFFLNFVLLSVLLLSLGGIFLYRNVYLKGKNSSQALLYPAFKKEAAAKIEIDNRGSKTVLEKKGNRWMVAGKKKGPAREEFVAQMLAAVATLRRGDVASENLSRREVFHLGDGALHLKVFGGDKTVLAEIWLGKAGPDWASTYLRKAKENKILLVKGDLKSVFEHSEYRDLTIFSFDKDKVKKLALEAKKRTITLKKDEEDGSAWKTAHPLLSALADLKAEDLIFDKDPKELGLDRPLAKITAFLADGEKKTLSIGKKTKTGGYYAKRSDKEPIYIISSASHAALDFPQPARP